MSKGNFNFQTMTTTNTDNMSGYEEALDFIFEDPKLLNIAITGPYGSGKSSVIETYENNFDEKKFMNISLAEFTDTNNGQDIKSQENNKDNEDNDTIYDKNSKRYATNLEGKILNQIIHQINPTNIPQTDFKTTIIITKRNILLITVLFTLFLLLSIFIMNFDNAQDIVLSFLKYESKAESTIKIMNISLVVTTVIWLFIFSYVIYLVIKGILHGNLFKKVKWNNHEIELFDKQKDSYFDKYLDEILYLFKQSPVDTYIFEDIDRYDKNNIFNRLREINYLINSKLEVEKDDKRSIRFIYLIKDELFISKERTKFFDFILPIVPVMDSSNSFNKMKDIFEKGGIIDDFDEVFLERICLYIDDLRLLKNIYNEYRIYYHRIEESNDGKGIDLIPHKLLSLIIYKNILPEDFTSLQFQDGYVFNLFEHKQQLIDRIIEEKEDKINGNKCNIKEITSETLNSIDELDALMLSVPGTIEVNGKEQYEFNNRAEWVRAIKDNDYQVIRSQRYSASDVNIKQKFEIMQESEEYQRRKKLIEAKQTNKVKVMEKENNDLKDEIARIQTLQLHELVEYDAARDYFELPFIEDNSIIKRYENLEDNYDLIIYIIRNGFIDETYADYMTYFIDNSMSRADKVFLRSITDRRPKERTYRLDNPAMIISKLERHEFNSDEVLNFQLLDYLLNNQSEDDLKQYYEKILLSLEDKSLFEFVFGFIEFTSNKARFVQDLNCSWISLFNVLLPSENIAAIDKKKYILRTINYSSVEDIDVMNIEACLTEYISNDASFLNIDNFDVGKMVEALDCLNVKFVSISYEDVNAALFHAIYEQHFYELNAEMLQLFMKVYYEVTDLTSIAEQGYTILSSKRDEPIYDYVYYNMDDFLQIIFDYDYQIKDNQNAALEIINHSEIDESTKVSYLERLITPINNIDEVEDYKLWRELVNQKSIDYKLRNIVLYVNKFDKVDDILTSFINESNQEMSINIDELEELMTEEDIYNFLYHVIKEKKIMDERYHMINREIGYKHSSINFSNIGDERFRILLEENLITVNENNLIHVREEYPKLIHEFILQNVRSYIDLLEESDEDDEANQLELFNLLTDEKVTEAYKLDLLEHYQEPLSLFDAEFTKEEQLQIMQRHFKLTDLEQLVSSYSYFSKPVQNSILEKCGEHLDELLVLENVVDDNLLARLIKGNEINDHYKKTLLSNNLESISLKNMREYFKHINSEDDFGRALRGGHPKINVNKENKRILNYFKKQEWITSSKFNPKNENQYIARGSIKLKDK